MSNIGQNQSHKEQYRMPEAVRKSERSDFQVGYTSNTGIETEDQRRKGTKK
ncbi:hypothetical protein [Heyndrickxia acidiproducens]|uniref:hypothetical protein n=1 Tax=Heyndrickxia acidiproducens TaxID=1121084 RepID=UPI0003803AE4|nr:hypothetical protein [Heyndrickxia acidiproducens]